MNIPPTFLLFVIWGFASSYVYAGNPLFNSPSDTTLVCNNLVQISLDFDCEAFLTGDEILEGYNGSYNDISVFITRSTGEPVPNPITGEYIGETLTITVVHIPSGNSCWGNALIEDKLAPSITCYNYTIQCFQNPSQFPVPIAVDNCDPNPTVALVNQVVNANNLCNGVTYTRTYVAFDNQNNFSSACTQVYNTVLPPLPDFPEDTIWACHIFQAHTNVINPTQLTGNLNSTGSGVPNVAIGNYCPYNVSQQTDTLAGCGNTFTLVRTWTVLNWCTGQIFLTDINGDDNVQIIKVKDVSPPAIVMPPYTVGANISGNHPNTCTAVNYLPAATVTDNCHSWTQRIFTPIGEAIYLNGQNGNDGGIIPTPGLPLGPHTIVYQATDICGNIDTLHVMVTVVDDTAPQTVCDEITDVALGTFGIAEVFAATFDDGTHDNCCIDTFLVRRMSSPCGNQDVNFDGSVFFCCEDIGNLVTVIFRAIDCSGNYNDCMVSVEVEDKILPVVVSCPPAQSVDCHFYAENLEIPLSQGNNSVLNQFGQPVFQDNCNLVYLDSTVTIAMDQCLQGTITRFWRVTDAGFNGQLTCTQVITVNHISDWVVEFPTDLTVTCTEELPPTGEPEIFFEDCELIAISYEDEIFTIVPDACFKIARTWTVINWCAVGPEIDQEIVESSEVELNFDLNGDGVKNNRTFQDGLNVSNFLLSAPLHGAQPDGYIIYQQTIKVNDDTKPVVTCEPVIDVCILETDCDVTFSIPAPIVQDCSSELTITANGALGTGLGPFVNVPPGNYSMTYQVSDHCGNKSFCSTLVQVRDCKNPTPYCINGLSITLEQDTIVTVTAQDFDAGSFDNCPGELIFSFSPDVNQTTMDFDCFSIGFVTVEVWVTDASGNQDFCETFVFVDDNQGVCQGPPLVSGSLTTENNLSIKNSLISLSGSAVNQCMTGSDGGYSFDVIWGGDYSISCLKDTLPLNGVTTYDLVLISKHILGTELLGSPYKIIAADANKSNSVTTFDLVAIRKLILQIDEKFPGNQSWRFIDKKFVFPNPANPFATPFPEVVNYNNVQADILNANFIGVKIGDVNLSANPQL